MEQRQLNVLIACEESQAVCKEFRALGHRAFSCDIQECSGGHPEWHVCGDVLPLLNGNCTFHTSDTHTHTQVGEWDLIIAHPPCTYLSGAGNGYFDVSKYGDSAVKRHVDRTDAVIFFMTFLTANCKHIAIENPVGFMNGHFRKPDQSIHPYFFAESDGDSDNYHKKRTCLWLKGLPTLKRSTFLDEPQPIYVDRKTGKKRYYTDAISGISKDGKKNRSKTFPGVAKAMAEQWGAYILSGSDQMSLFEEVSK